MLIQQRLAKAETARCTANTVIPWATLVQQVLGHFALHANIDVVDAVLAQPSFNLNPICHPKS